MRRTNSAALRAIMGLGLLMGVALFFTTLRASEPKPTADELLSARNFWERDGRLFKHGFDASVVAEIGFAARSNSTPPIQRLRANKLACDLAGNSNVGDIVNADAERAVATAMSHIESHLGDETVRKFSPQIGFTHLTVSERKGDGKDIWVLIETTDESRRGGLNVEVNPQTWKVVKIDHWGKMTTPPPAPVA